MHNVNHGPHVASESTSRSTSTLRYCLDPVPRTPPLPTLLPTSSVKVSWNVVNPKVVAKMLSQTDRHPSRLHEVSEGPHCGAVGRVPGCDFGLGAACVQHRMPEGASSPGELKDRLTSRACPVQLLSSVWCGEHCAVCRCQTAPPPRSVQTASSTPHPSVCLPSVPLTSLEVSTWVGIYYLSTSIPCYLPLLGARPEWSEDSKSRSAHCTPDRDFGSASLVALTVP